MKFGIEFREKGPMALFLILSLFYIYWQVKTVYGGDGGDFLSSAAVWGIPHPPGYPLYAFLSAILDHLNFYSTAAWRIGLLSSIPTAIMIYFFYKLLKIYFSTTISLIASFFAAFLYPIWLYAEVAEVFSLNSLFIVLMTYCACKFSKTFNKKWLYLLFITLGISFSHHHTVIFLIPAIMFWFIKLPSKYKNLKLWLLIIPGLFIYLYLPIAASRNPIINWGDPVTLENFINVFLRKNYGTFFAHQLIDNSVWGRFINIMGFLRFWVGDFSIIGLFLCLIGFMRYWFIKNIALKRLYQFAFVSISSYLFFIFYASFPLDNDFSVATFERFLIIPYIFLTIFLAFGIDWCKQILIKIIDVSHKRRIIIGLLYLVLAIVLPLKLLSANYHKITILKNDKTAENFALDLLNSIPVGGSISLVSDTTFFDTVFAYYSLGYRSNEIKFINPFALNSYHYFLNIKKAYPDLNLNYNKNYQLEDFVKDNPSLNINIIPNNMNIKGYVLIPFGLVSRYYKEDNYPSVDFVVNENKKLWAQYQNPLSGSLSQYTNLYLSDVVSYYKENSKRLGEYLLKHNKYNDAKDYLLKSLSYSEKDPETHLLLGRVYMETKECDLAKKEFNTAKNLIPDNPFPDAYLGQLYLNCYDDKEKSAEFQNSCVQKEEVQQVPVLTK